MEFGGILDMGSKSYILSKVHTIETRIVGFYGNCSQPYLWEDRDLRNSTQPKQWSVQFLPRARMHFYVPTTAIRGTANRTSGTYAKKIA